METDSNSLLDLAFENTPIIYKNMENNVNHREIYLLSSDESNAHRSKLFIPHEYLIFFMLKRSVMFRDTIRQSIGKYINICLQKNSVHLLGIISYNFPNEYSQYMGENGIASLNNLMKHPEINQELFRLLPNMNYDCSKITRGSVLHDIVEDKKRTFWTSRHFNFSRIRFLQKSLDECFDTNGYNFLHRSVMGGNVEAFFFLRSLGMSLNVKTRDGRHLIELLVDNAPCFVENTDEEEFVTSMSQESWKKNNIPAFNYNVLSSYFARHTRVIKNMKLLYICNSGSESLSFIHKVAAKGLEALLLAIQKEFGSHALNCRNKNNITTNFLLRFFNHHPKLSLKLSIRPRSDTVASLFLKLLIDFKPFFINKHSLEQKCKYRMKNFRNNHMMYNCAAQMYKEKIYLHRQYIKLTGLKSWPDFVESSPNIHYLQTLGFSEKIYLAFFEDTLAGIRNSVDNPKDFNFRKLLLNDRTLRNAKDKKCFIKTKNMENINSTECLKLIAEMGQFKIENQRRYHIDSCEKMNYLIFLYEDKFDVPFENDMSYFQRFKFNNFVYYFLSAIYFCSNNLEFHMHKKFEFLNWFKSCKSCLAKKMVRKISVSTLSQMKNWKSSPKNYFMKLDFERPHVSEATNRPLEYYSHFETDDMT